MFGGKVDSEIEQYVKDCDICNTLMSKPKKAELIKYNECKEVLVRVHCDFVGTVRDKMYSIFTDCHSKWPEVYVNE